VTDPTLTDPVVTDPSPVAGQGDEAEPNKPAEQPAAKAGPAIPVNAGGEPAIYAAAAVFSPGPVGGPVARESRPVGGPATTPSPSREVSPISQVTTPAERQRVSMTPDADAAERPLAVDGAADDAGAAASPPSDSGLAGRADRPSTSSWRRQAG